MANCTLITTESGTVTHVLDGALHAAVYPDCILNGCTISANGSTVTMGAGTFIIGGRVIDNASNSSWSLPVNGAAASLVCAINDETLSFRTVASADPVITQEDINLSGTTYEAVIASCNVVDGALTIVSSLPRYGRNGGILYGTGENPPTGSFADGTLYVQYEA